MKNALEWAFIAFAALTGAVWGCILLVGMGVAWVYRNMTGGKRNDLDHLL